MLRKKERGNYTDAELIHRPDWAYLLYFKRAPTATLAKYTRNPRFQARQARYNEAQLKKLINPWIDRLSAERLFTGFGLNTRLGRAEVDMVVSEAEYRAISNRNGWGATPDFIQLQFGDAPAGPDVDPSVAREPRGALDPLDLVLLEEIGHAVGEPLHHAVLALVQRGHVDLRLGHLDAVVLGLVADLLEQLGAVQQRLAGDAPDAHAGAAERRLLLDARRLEPELRRADGGHVPAGARAEHHQVERLLVSHLSSGQFTVWKLGIRTC